VPLVGVVAAECQPSGAVRRQAVENLLRGDQARRRRLLGKQRGVTPEGWREASAPYGEEGTYESVADIVDHESLLKVRASKQAAKAAAKAARQDSA